MTVVFYLSVRWHIVGIDERILVDETFQLLNLAKIWLTGIDTNEYL